MKATAADWIFVNTYGSSYSASLTVGLIMATIASITLVGFNYGTQLLDINYTGDLQVLGEIYKLNRENDGGNYLSTRTILAILSYLSSAVLIIILSIFGFALIHCGDHKANSYKNHNSVYLSLVLLSVTAHLCVMIWAKAESQQLKAGWIDHELRDLQNRIRVIEKGDRLELNREGVAFQDVQKRFHCCGVRWGYEWVKGVGWFSAKYANVTSASRIRVPSFPCQALPSTMLWPIADDSGDELSSSNCIKGVDTPDCVMQLPFFMRGCGEAVRRRSIDYLCLFTKLSSFYILIQLFLLSWLLIICRYFNVPLVLRDALKLEKQQSESSNISYILLKDDDDESSKDLTKTSVIHL